MIAADLARDCPECSSAGSVERGVCQICFAELGEVGPAPAPLRLADVLDELRRIAGLGAGDRASIVAACDRAERLLLGLRAQFLHDVIGPSANAPKGSEPIPSLQ